MSRSTSALSRRERQIMDVLFRRGRATAAEVAAELPDAPSRSAVRAALWLLRRKGRVRHEEDGPRHVYFPAEPREHAREGAVSHLLRTFFGGSRAGAVSAILGSPDASLSDEEYERLRRLLDAARGRGGEEEVS